MRIRSAAVAALLLLGACRTGSNYSAADGPRYAGPIPRQPAPERRGDTLRIVSFNIEMAARVDSALFVLQADPRLSTADVVLLQEMDERGTRRVAESLGMGFVYYPASRRFKTGRDFGNAVLTRWPIVEDAKILLPHMGVLGGTQRIATAATIRVGDSLVRVYSVHLGTLINATPVAQRGQLRTVLADADRYPRVIIGGDMNSHGAGKAARKKGYAWPTEHGPKTTWLGRWDHIFLKGLAPDSTGSGTVTDMHHASDHRAVWATAILP
jgi:endonuclease/exonuclease/phosphatase family metal-dependent hydrolase